METPWNLSNDENGPEVMFLPLATASTELWRGLPPAVFARRIPDFLRQVLNDGQNGPTALLELQSAAPNAPVAWVQLETPPDQEEAFAFLPDDLDVRAVVAGEIEAVDNGLRLEFAVHRADDADEPVTAKVGGTITFDDPVPGLVRFARHLAHLLGLRFREPPRGLLTRSGAAFRLFLQGLDNSMLLSGDLEIALPADREALMRPFADALELDPTFGLALRIANSTAVQALDVDRIDVECVRRFLDRCYATQPADGEACVEVAENLTELGDDQRAMQWLKHATKLDPPPARGLESLGLLMARAGEPGQARGLWEQGLDIDGHPDFFSHLAQLSFAEDRIDDAWDLTVRGLRRLRERTVRASEWDAVGSGAGVLLECLHAQLSHREAPAAVAAALADLRTLLSGDDRAFLGLCMLAIGSRREARGELVAGLRLAAGGEVRDLAVRALLQIDVDDFEGRFARASDRALRGRNPRPAIEEFRSWLKLQPEFWPALFFTALAKRRLGAGDEALDLLASALEVAPGQPDVLFALAEGFDRRRNPKRALELVEEAMVVRPREVRLHGARARYLHHLGRIEEAKNAISSARSSGLDSPELRRLARRLRRT
jgi:Flp pilus assembly protein TadD